MKLLDLVDNALKSEAFCLEFLKSIGIFCDSAAICPGKEGFQCLRPMRTIQRTNHKKVLSHAWRCSKKSCRAQSSIRVTNRFFGFPDAKGRTTCNISLQKILLIVYLSVYSNDTLDQLVIKSGHRKSIICDWINLCREFCSTVIRSLPKMVGTNETAVQIDESYSQDRRKYNRGPFLNGNDQDEEENRLQEEICQQEGNNYETDKVVGPWVFGLYMSEERIRFYVFQNRTGNIHAPLICANVEQGSTVVSDQWAASKRLGQEDLVLERVNHSKDFVNPETGFHTQAIELAWREGKKWLHHARHAGPYLQNHLHEVSWPAYHRHYPKGLLLACLEDVHLYYSEESV